MPQRIASSTYNGVVRNTETNRQGDGSFRVGAAEEYALMVQVVVYGHRDQLQHIAEPIIAEIDGCLVDTLKYPTGRRYYRFIPLESWAFVYPNDRTDEYTIVEITL